MSLRQEKLITDLRVFSVKNVSRDHGRKRLKELQEQRLIDPLRTPTGRTLLSFDEAERLAAAL
jgi:hypothetical protein